MIGGPYIGKNIISTDNKLSSKTIKISCNNFLSLPGRRVVLHDVLQDPVNAADCLAQQEEELAVLDVVNDCTEGIQRMTACMQGIVTCILPCATQNSWILGVCSLNSCCQANTSFLSCPHLNLSKNKVINLKVYYILHQNYDLLPVAL